MKPLHLNLASRPYRDYRPLYAVVVAVSLLITFLAFTNFETWWQYRTETRTTRGKIEQLDRDTANERARAAEVRARLGRIDTVALDRQTRFVNAKLAERTFSWSELLDRLEHVMADDVRVTTITPAFAESDPGVVRLMVACESKSSNGMIETLNRLHASPQFKDPFPSGETEVEGTYIFNLTVEYRPTLARAVRR